MKKRWFVLTFIALTLALLPRAEQWLHSRNPILKVGSLSLSQRVDPHVSDDTQLVQIYRHVVEPLFYLDQENTLHPLLAKEVPLVSSDGLSYQFELKKGIFFHDGNQMDSYDVEFFFLRLFSSMQPGLMASQFSAMAGSSELIRGQTSQLSGFQILDTFEFVIHLAHEDPFFLYRLADAAAGIYSRKAYLDGSQFWGRGVLVGSGPYQMIENDGQAVLRLRSFASYHQPMKRVPSIDFYHYLSQDSLMQAYLSRHLDVVSISWQEYLAAKPQLDNREVKVQPLTASYSLLLNQHHSQLADSRVRKAIAYAIDRQEIAESFALTEEQISRNYLPPNILGSTTFALSPPTNLERAKELLTLSGYPRGFKLVDYYNSKSDISLGLMLQQQLARIGIELEFVLQDIDQWQAIRSKDQLPLMLYRPSLGFQDPDNFFYPLLHSSSYVSSWFVLSQRKADLDTLLELARVIPDRNERALHYQAIEQFILDEEQALIPLVMMPRVLLVHSAWQEQLKDTEHEQHLSF
jgi:oligopeptide transport system substrate-binding protein